VERAAATELARDGAAPGDSPFRRRWTWRTRAWVVLAGWVIALVLRLVYRTLRVRLVDHSGLGDRGDGPPIIGAFWHDGILLAPLLVSKLGWPRPVTVMLSWHRDAEIAAQAMRRLGIGAVRGSATRGRLGGLRGLVAACRRGEDVVIVPDGPRGPRHQAKEGAAQLARATGLVVLAVGTAAHPARRLASWDRLQVPWPFARAAIVLAPPVVLPAEKPLAVAALEAALARATAEAAALVAAASA
jgi:lysophospholipid acyltransferase (LPLAT)-like uncharacterized protein